MMDAKTREALEKSIQHWKDNAAAEAASSVSTSSSKCALCSLFIKREECDKCPVKQRTGMGFCAESPYSAAFKTWVDWKLAPDSVYYRNIFRAAAQREIEFLESLREPT